MLDWIATTFMSLTVAESELSANGCILVCFRSSLTVCNSHGRLGEGHFKVGWKLFWRHAKPQLLVQENRQFTPLWFFHAPLLDHLPLCIIHSVFIMGCVSLSYRRTPAPGDSYGLLSTQRAKYVHLFWRMCWKRLSKITPTCCSIHTCSSPAYDGWAAWFRLTAQSSLP